MEVNCPQCQALLRIADENAGHQTRCPSCSAVFTADRSPVPAPSPPLASASRLDAGNPYAPTFTEPAAQPEFSSDWAPRQITIDEVFSNAWTIFKDQWLMACLVVLIMGGINFAANMAQQVIVPLLNNVVNEPWIVFAVQAGMFVGFWLFQMWLQIGQTMVMLDIARGREINLGKLVAGGPFLIHTVLAVIMTGLIIGSVVLLLIGIPAAGIGLAMQDGDATAMAAVLGGVIAVIPIMILSLMFSQIQLLIIDRGSNAVESLRTSYEITNGNKFTIFIIGILLGVIGVCTAVLGLLALCVGIFPAMVGFGGFSSLVFVVMYLSMTGQQVATPRQLVSPGPAT